MLKKILLSGVLVFIIGHVSMYAQKVSIDELFETEIEYSGTILEGSEVHGYLFIYSIDKPQKDEIKMEYRYFDRNLNPVFNGRFSTYKGGDFQYATIMNNSLVITRSYKIMSIDFDITLIILPLDDKNKGKEMVLRNNKIVPFNYAERQRIKGLRYPPDYNNQIYRVIRSGDSHYILAFANHNEGMFNTEFNIFNPELKSIFKFEVQAKKKEPYSFLMIQGITNGYFVFTESFMKKPTQLIKRDLLIFSLDSIHLLSRHTLEEKGKPFVHQLRFRELDGMLYQSAFYSEYEESEYFNMKKPLGVYLKIYDSTGKKTHDKYSVWKDMNKDIDLSVSGILFKDRPYLSDFQPVDKNLIYYIVEKTTQKETPLGSAAPNKHTVPQINYERYANNFGYVGFFLGDEPKITKDTNFNKVDKWESFYDLDFTQRMDGGNRYFFTMKEHTNLITVIKTDKTGGFIFYSVDKNGIKSTNKFLKRVENIEIEPFMAKSGYILIAEKDTKKKTYSLRLERMEF